MTDEMCQAWQISSLPLHRLLAFGRRARREPHQRAVRVAVLGDCATQHYTEAVTAALKLRGWWPEVYEAEFDTLRQDILTDDSGLYQHKPQVILLFNCTQALAGRFAATSAKATFADDVTADMANLWERLKRRSGAAILQHTFVVPIDRPYGNQTALYPDTFAGAISRINARMLNLARDAGVALIDNDWQASYFGKERWLDERLWCHSKQALSPSYLPSLAKGVSDSVLAELGVGVKCVVVDLDNTLWGGVLADDGASGIEIGQAEVGLAFSRFQQTLQELRDRGVLLAVCSRNHHDAVRDVLTNHPDMILRYQDFSVVVANHGDKVSNILTIRDRLNLGLDSFVFLDDSPFERDMVRRALPEVQVPEMGEDPAGFSGVLARLGLFEGRAATNEDRDRRAYYQKDAERDALRNQFSGLTEYLADLKMEADQLPFDAYALPRVHQLVQRSNQFNLTTIRYTESELAALAQAHDVSAFCVRLTDRLGDNGIIVVVIGRTHDKDLVIDTWIMSCRVLGRGVESLVLDLIVRSARARNCDRIVGRFVPTPKNGLVVDLFTRLGFTAAGTDGNAYLFELPVGEYSGKPGPIALRTRSAQEAS